MEMAFHEAFKQLQTPVTKQKSAGTVEYIEEGRKVESGLGPWGITNGSAVALKVETSAGRTREPR